MQAFEHICLSTLEIEKKKSKLIQKIALFLVTWLAAAGASIYVGNIYLIILSIVLCLVAIALTILSGILMLESYVPLAKHPAIQEEFNTMIQDHPELAEYKTKVVAQNREFIMQEFYAMKLWCLKKNKETVTDKLYQTTT